MAKQKKSRKVGQIGVPKSNNQRDQGSKRLKTKHQKPKNRKGLKPGNRQHLAENDVKTTAKQKSDTRIGSKKLVNLDKYKSPDNVSSKTNSPIVKKRFHSPVEELEAIENNKTLESLLVKQEKTRLTPEEAQFVERLTSRYAELCEMLGIDTEESESEEDIDPFANLDAIKLDDYKD